MQDFVPTVLDTKIYDEIIAIDNDDAFAEGRAFAVSEGVLVGISSGAALKAATILAQRPENKGKNIVALLQTQVIDIYQQHYLLTTNRLLCDVNNRTSGWYSHHHNNIHFSL